MTQVYNIVINQWRFMSKQCQQLLTEAPLKYCLQGTQQIYQGPHQKKSKVAQASRSKGSNGITDYRWWGRVGDPLFYFIFIYLFISFAFHFLKPMKYVLGYQTRNFTPLKGPSISC